ncbi:inhibin alpha chain [Genypterus blacodes]|uniref:inhibin alpha chain n=1 Tax=Genypterus blacodes TaxID=154954 RepID=UPI003F75B46C
MVSWALLLLGSVWLHSLTQACCGDELPREAVLDWLRESVLEGLGLEEPPVPTPQGPDGNTEGPEAMHGHHRYPRTSWTAWVNQNQANSPNYETSQIILFPSSDSSCTRSDSVPGEPAKGHFTYYFQPSMNSLETLVTSASFWFYAGDGATTNSSAPLFILSPAQQLLPLQAAEAPSVSNSDGWTTYHLDQKPRASVSEGPFVLQVRCPTCQCHANEPDKMPFLHLHARPQHPKRFPRHAGATTIPWSPSALGLLQRPPQERSQHSDCHREEMEISFEELGWDNWIIEPKVLTFHYCHGNCSTADRTAASLGITQCCAPVPGTMKSVRITTTSDGGYSYKYETLPNIVPEECTCI